MTGSVAGRQAVAVPSLFDRVKELRSDRKLARAIDSMAKDLHRIAEALERAYPVPGVIEKVDVVDTDEQLALYYDAIDRQLRTELGREPTADEIVDAYEERKHLWGVKT